MIWQNRFCPNLALPYWIYHSDCTGIGLAGLLSKQLANQMWGAYNLDTSSWNVYWGRILVVNSLQIRKRKVKLEASSGNTLYVLKGCQLSSALMGGWWLQFHHGKDTGQSQVSNKNCLLSILGNPSAWYSYVRVAFSSSPPWTPAVTLAWNHDISYCF